MKNNFLILNESGLWVKNPGVYSDKQNVNGKQVSFTSVYSDAYKCDEITANSIADKFQLEAKEIAK